MGLLCFNRYINCFTLDWNQLAFAVPETVINLIVGGCFCYHKIDPLVSPFLCAWYNQCRSGEILNRMNFKIPG